MALVVLFQYFILTASLLLIPAYNYLQLDVAKSELEIYSTQQDGLKNQEKEAKENLENGKEKLKDLKRFTCN